MIPLEPFRTEIRVVKERGIWRKVPLDHPQGVVYWAEWRPLTVGVWRKVYDRKSILELSERCWRKLLISTNLVKMSPCVDRVLDDKSFQAILKFCPSLIPRELLYQYTKQTTMNPFEEERIERDCMKMWASDSGSIQNPPPLLAEALEMMSIQTRYGIPGFKSLEEIPYQLFLMMKLVSRAYSTAQDIKYQIKTTHNRAIQLGRGMGSIPAEEQGLYQKPAEMSGAGD